MKTTVKQYVLAAPVLIAILIVLNSFKPAQNNSIANGGGMTGDVHFNFNAVEQKDGTVVGHFQIDGDYYNVTCAEWFGNQAIIYTDGGEAYLVTDNGEGSSATPDTISEPLLASCESLELVDFLLVTRNDVTGGNIQVKE